MQDTYHIKEKLLLVITNLMGRAIDEARKVPYMIEQDNIIDILIKDPSLYQQMVLDEQQDGSGVPKGKLIVKLDILSQIGEFKDLDGLDLNFSQETSHETNPAPVFAQVNSLTKLFMAYNNNMMTLFEKNYEQFLERYRKTLYQAAKSIGVIDLSSDDLVGLEKMAEAHLGAGQYTQAFSFSRLFNPEVLKNEIIHFPSPTYSLSQKLIANAPKDFESFGRLIKFILRACYISQNTWRDIFIALLNLVERDPQLYQRALLIDLIEQDVVFSCNLLHATYDSLRGWTSAQRKTAIEDSLQHEKRRI